MTAALHRKTPSTKPRKTSMITWPPAVPCAEAPDAGGEVQDTDDPVTTCCPGGEQDTCDSSSSDEEDDDE